MTSDRDIQHSCYRQSRWPIIAFESLTVNSIGTGGHYSIQQSQLLLQKKFASFSTPTTHVVDDSRCYNWQSSFSTLTFANGLSSQSGKWALNGNILLAFRIWPSSDIVLIIFVRPPYYISFSYRSYKWICFYNILTAIDKKPYRIALRPYQSWLDDVLEPVSDPSRWDVQATRSCLLLIIVITSHVHPLSCWLEFLLCDRWGRFQKNLFWKLWIAHP